MYDKLVTNVNSIDTGEFVLKSQCNIDKLGMEKKADKKIHDTCGIVKKAYYNTNVTEIATTVALNVVENKIPNVSDLGHKKKGYVVKISDFDSKCFPKSDYN